VNLKKEYSIKNAIEVLDRCKEERAASAKPTLFPIGPFFGISGIAKYLRDDGRLSRSGEAGLSG
jgi:hypothetical protein